MRSNYRFTDPNSYILDLDDEFTQKDTWLDGNLYVWGRQRTSGGTIFNVTSPVRVDLDYNWRTVAAGAEHIVAIKTNGTIWSWGDNSEGQLGLGDITHRASPVQIGQDVDWVYASCGQESSAAIRRDGTIWVWGNNTSGQLGLGDRVHRSSPIQLGSRTDWKSLHFGIFSSGAIDNNNRLWVWGSNFQFTLGLGDNTGRSSPVQLGSDRSWRQILFDISLGRAIDNNGNLWSWGDNVSGQIGNGDPLNNAYITPIQIGNDNNWRYVSGAHAIRSNGTLWAWGNNTNGQLGLGDRVHRSSPTQVGSLTDWKQINSTQSFVTGLSIATKKDGTLWVWGNNEFGQLGLDDSVHRSSPVQIGSSTNWKKIPDGALALTNAAILDVTNY